jgi:hypothetical protein
MLRALQPLASQSVSHKLVPASTERGSFPTVLTGLFTTFSQAARLPPAQSPQDFSSGSLSAPDRGRALGQTSGGAGPEAMQTINREFFRWIFMTLFLGLVPVSLIFMG